MSASVSGDGRLAAQAGSVSADAGGRGRLARRARGRGWEGCRGLPNVPLRRIATGVGTQAQWTTSDRGAAHRCSARQRRARRPTPMRAGTATARTTWEPAEAVRRANGKVNQQPRSAARRGDAGRRRAAARRRVASARGRACNLRVREPEKGGNARKILRSMTPSTRATTRRRRATDAGGWGSCRKRCTK